MTCFFQLQDITGKIWEVGECLGRGGFARVYDTPTDNSVVLKVFKTKKAYTTELFAYQSLLALPALTVFKKKRGLGHLGFPALHGHGSQNNQHFIVIQKLFPMKNLIEESYRDNNLVMMVVQLLDMLEFMHKNGWTHNDLKYDNIMIDKYRNVYLIDFGLITSFIAAKEAPADHPIIGTRSYMSLDAHRGFVNPPRGDLVNIVFMLKLLLTAPWDIDSYAYSAQTATLIAKEAFVEDPQCGPFTPFCQAVLKLGYFSTPDYKKLKTLLPTQPKVELIRNLYTTHCGFNQPSWGFSVIFQTHIIPYLFRITQKLSTVKHIKKSSKITVQDLLFILDTKYAPGQLLDGLSLIGETADAYTRDAQIYISACIESWIVHIAKALKQLLQQQQTTVSRAIHQLSVELSVARP